MWSSRETPCRQQPPFRFLKTAKPWHNLYLDQQVWLKGSVIIEGGAFQHVGSAWHTSWKLNSTNILSVGADRPYHIDGSHGPISMPITLTILC